MSLPILLVGSGGHAKVVLAACIAAGRNVAAILDEDPSKHGSKVLGHRVVGGLEALSHLHHCEVIIAIGNNKARVDLSQKIPLKFATVVHPNAWVHESVQIGAGSIVMAGAIIQPETKIGTHAIINTKASLDHDCTLGHYVHVAPGVSFSGGVEVGNETLIGVGACARPGVKIGERCTIGAGAVLVKDIPNDSKALGIPARPVP